MAGPIPEHATYNRILSTPPRLTTVDLLTTSPTIQVIDPAPSPIPSSPVTHCPLPIAYCPLSAPRFPLQALLLLLLTIPAPIHLHTKLRLLPHGAGHPCVQQDSSLSTSFDNVIGCTDPPYRCSSSIHRFRHPSRFNAHIHNGDSIHRQPTCLRLVLSKPRHLPKVSGSSPSLGPRSGTPFPDSFSTSSLLSWRRPQQIRQLKPSS